ncbi:FAD-binding and (Fe-S)-binding domain-containing protein [Kutzneria sp. NPDC052558]|uniref:FAD-binding and (Fe-S)-binding domain-containing protein n=1 Tax=Kutzneria sp. NPDC052558 TaxID=3364121 RepID=UPI0037C6494C
MDLAAQLDRTVHGEVRFDPGSRAAYSTDASNYRQVPIGVVVPRSIEDGVAAIGACHEAGVPVLSRGGGTSLAGQCCNEAVVLDWSKYCDRLVSVDVAAKTAVVEPGIALDRLNDQLAGHGLMVGPKPSTHVSCTIGGMIGNNSCGSTAQAYGKMVDSVVRLEILTHDGCRAWVGETSDEDYERIVAGGGRLAELYRGLRDIRDTYLAEIRTRYPKIPRRVSGYNLDSLLPENGFNVAQALVGSESTLVTVLRAEIRLVDVLPARTLVVLGFPDITDAADCVPHVLPHNPVALEGVDEQLVQLEHSEHLAEQAIRQLPKGSGWLMVQFAGADQEEVDRRARALCDDLKSPSIAFLDDPAREEELWQAREAGLGATAYPPQGPETHEGWEDAAVPPDKLGDYLREFRDLLERYEYENASLYGHFGHGCVHTRIPFDLTTADGVAKYRRFARHSAELVVSFGGSLSGEHGDGQSRGELLPLMFGDRLVEAFGKVKALFDPDDLMNPGKVVHPHRLDQNLRQGSDYRPWEPATTFAYPDDDNRFAKAAARCVGVGKCRGHESGVMCPSYRATREEEHSTRGRARLLFEMLNGSVITDGWRSEAVHDALDLCLACKGCQSDCPVNVDMATYKAEFLSHHYDGRLRPLSHYSMGWLPLWARLAALAPTVVNSVSNLRLVKALGGIAQQRTTPLFAAQRFSRWFAGRTGPAGSRGAVLLWPDTFTNNFHPAIGKAAVQVLAAAGFEVISPHQTVCCGLTWISTGQLSVAKKVARRTLDVLRPQLRDGTPIVVLEPSCAAVFRDDLPKLLHGDQDAHRLAHQTKTLAEILTERAPDWRPPTVGLQAVAQPHCHHHAVLGFGTDEKLMRHYGIDVDVLDAGCCGLAGNFGFEKEHYEVSMACAEDKLLPELRGAGPGTLVLADGFSCRTQIDQSDVDHRPMHLAEVLAAALQGKQPRPGRPSAPGRAARTAVAAAALATVAAPALAWLVRRSR